VGPKGVKFFLPLKTKKTTFFAKNFKFQGGQCPHCPPFQRLWMQVLPSGLPKPSDVLTHGPNSACPRAPFLWGPTQLLPMTTHYQLQIWESAQRHHFTICFETSENANVWSKPAQLRKLEGPNYQHKFAAGRKSLFHLRCRDFVVAWKKFWNDNYLFEIEL